MKRAALIAVAVLVAGCGYTVRSSPHLPVSVLTIGPVGNRTTQPNIEDILHEKLAEECLRRGIRVAAGSDAVLSGDILEYSMVMVSEKERFSAEFEIVIRAEFVLTGPDGSRREIRAKTSPFIESFAAKGDLNSIMSLRDGATERALESLAREIFAEVAYR